MGIYTENKTRLFSEVFNKRLQITAREILTRYKEKKKQNKPTIYKYNQKHCKWDLDCICPALTRLIQYELEIKEV